ncbi:MAG: hypothetical protein CMH56_05285 [Myxococcales bacterium]|nr:hypothetical protein [Myxococcales bacterium]|tara:strand:- start:2535 stop:3848 length:1314 start_codon:yes stop_codon:yes gene_type:complete
MYKITPHPLKGFYMIRQLLLFSLVTTVIACPAPTEPEEKPEETIFNSPPASEGNDAGLESTVVTDAGSPPQSESADAGMSTTGPSEPSDAGPNAPPQNLLSGHLFKRLGTMRGVRSLYGPLASFAINQATNETPSFVTTETTNSDGHRVITWDFSVSNGTLTDYYPSDTFVETYDAEGQFISWNWSNSPSYTCTYHPDGVSCEWVTDSDGTSCIDSFGLDGDVVDSTCETPPGQFIQCTTQMDEHTVCRYTTAAVDCNDVYDPNFNRVDSMCMGLLPGLNTHGMCMVEPDRIVCNTDVNTTHCEVVLTDIFNVTSRVCETISHCHWGPEECDLDALGECGCSWRDKAREVLCEIGSMDTNDAIPEPDTTNWLHALLYDETMIDGDRADIYIDTHDGVFVLKITGSGFGGDETVGPFWYGPFNVDGPMAEDGGLLNCQ